MEEKNVITFEAILASLHSREVDFLSHENKICALEREIKSEKGKVSFFENEMKEKLKIIEDTQSRLEEYQIQVESLEKALKEKEGVIHHLKNVSSVQGEKNKNLEKSLRDSQDLNSVLRTTGKESEIYFDTFRKYLEEQTKDRLSQALALSAMEREDILSRYSTITQIKQEMFAEQSKVIRKEVEKTIRSLLETRRQKKLAEDQVDALKAELDKAGDYIVNQKSVIRNLEKLIQKEAEKKEKDIIKFYLH